MWWRYRGNKLFRFLGRVPSPPPPLPSLLGSAPGGHPYMHRSSKIGTYKDFFLSYQSLKVDLKLKFGT